MSRLRSWLVFLSLSLSFLLNNIHEVSAAEAAGEAVISKVSGSGPYPLGTREVEIVVSTDVSAKCKIRLSDSNVISDWKVYFNTTDNLNHHRRITLENDVDTVRYIRCLNNDNNVFNSSSFVFPISFSGDGGSAGGELGVPQHFSVDRSSSDDTQFTLSWDAFSGASFYHLMEKKNDGLWTAITLAEDQLSIVLSRPESGDYQFKISACSDQQFADCGAFSDEIVVWIGAGQSGSEPVISYVSGSGPHPYGTNTIKLIVSTDINAICRVNYQDTGSYQTWTHPLLTEDNLLHRINVPVSGTVNTQKYVRCQTLDTLATNTTSFIFPITINSPSQLEQPINLQVDNAYNTGSYTLSWSPVEDAVTYLLEESVNGNAWTQQFLPGGNASIPFTKIIDGHYKYFIFACADESALNCGPHSDAVNVDVAGSASNNLPPSITSAPILSGAEYASYVYDVDATDPNVLDTLTYSLTSAPQGMSIDTGMGLISWTPTASQLGTQLIVVSVSDDAGLVDTQSYQLVVANVNDAPYISSAAITSATENLPYVYQVQAIDNDAGDSLTFSLSQSPQGMTIDANTGDIAWSPTYSQVGDQSVTIVVTDSAGLTGTQIFVINVINVNDAPEFTSTPVTLGQELVAYAYQLTATDKDNDPLLYSPLNIPTGMALSFDGILSWTPTVGQEGSHNVSINITDPDLASATQNFVIQVTRRSNNTPVADALNTATSEDTSIAVSLTATDVDGETLTFTVATNPSNGVLSGTAPDLVYTPNANYFGTDSFTFKANDGIEESNIATVNIAISSVNDAPKIVSNAVISVNESQTYSYTVLVEDPDFNDVLIFNLSTAPSGMNINQASGEIVWQPSATQIGSHPVTVSVSDSANSNDVQTFNVAVIDSDDDNDGVNNSADQCPNTPAGESVNTNGCSASQLDSDNDGVSDAIDQCSNTPAGATVDANGCSTSQLDSDNDGVSDAIDQCSNTPVGATVDASGCSTSQLDSDNDGVSDAIDQCPNTPAGATVNANGCSTSQLDSDSDGVSDAIDQCPNTPAGETVNTNGCSTSQLDSDNDGVSDAIDQCPNTPAGATVNANGCSTSQLDSDNDGVSDAIDQCSNTPAGATVDASGCSTSQLDSDNDGVSDAIDQCPNTPAGATVNANGCSTSQLDSDSDGVSDANDQCPSTPDGESVDANGCSTSQLDSDNDGVSDAIDQCPNTPAGETVNANGCSTSQLDSDNDGVSDALDQCSNTPADATVDVNGCSTSQLDSDNDGVPDAIDQCPNTPAGVTVNANGCAGSQLDDDSDGVSNDLDQCPNTPAGETVNANGCPPSQLDTDNDGVTDDLDQCPNTPANEVANITGCSPSQTAGPFKSSPIPQTGSDIVYFASDDADLSWGTTRSYTRNNGNETVTDNTNNLIWQDDLDAQSSKMNWFDAGAYCAASTSAGITDWRLPSPLELLYLLDFNTSIIRTQAKIDNAFVNVGIAQYWTDERRLAFSNNSGNIDYAISVGFLMSEIVVDPNNELTQTSLNVRCVSGNEQFAPSLSNLGRFAENLNVVFDINNKLMWQENSEVGSDPKTLTQAISYCDQLTLDGSTDWRLPNINEFHTISSYDASERNRLFAVRGDMWTSTAVNIGATNLRAYRVGWVGFGFVYQDLQDVTGEYHFPRCVRDYSEPVAVSGGSRTISVGDPLVLDASQSYDPDGGAIVFYRWFDAGSLISTEMIASNEALGIGVHQMELVVTDNNSISGSQFFTLTVVAQANVAPVATSNTVSVNEDEFIDITLQASDSNGDVLSYQFVDLPTNGNVVLVGQNSAKYTPNADYFGTDSFTFKANDGVVDSNIATVTVNVQSVNGGAPFADAGGDQRVTLGDSVTLDGSQSTDDELITFYEWSENGVVLSNDVSFVLNNLAVGSHTITLQVFDQEGLNSTDTLAIEVMYELSQCIGVDPINDLGFDDKVPTEDIAWIGANYVDVEEIELAFNNARFIDEAVFKYFNMPDQLTWDSWTNQQQGLYLINSERQARNLTPLAGADPDVISVVMDYAEFIRSNNEVISHTRSSDGASPTDRLDENAQLVGNYSGSYENLAAMYEPTSVTKATVQAIYFWLYVDKNPLSGASWGHRLIILGTTYTDSSGDEFEEGVLGFGVATGDYDPNGNSINGQGAVVVINAIGPNAGWDHSTAETVDISDAQRCNNSIELFVDETLIDTTELVALTISPTNITLNPGDSQALQVFGIYADNRQEDFTSAVSFVSDSRSVVSVNSGIVTGENIGTVTLFSRLNGIDSNRIKVSVGAETNTDNLQGTIAEQYLPYIPGNATVDRYDPLSFSVFNGLVSDRDGQPLSGVSIAFHNAPEYGSVVTDSEGKFVLAGGAGHRTLVYTKEGYLTIQRSTIAASSAWSTLPDVIMLAHDTKMTSIDLTSAEPQVHQSTIITDAFGSRSTTLIFDEINSVTVTSKDGVARTLSDFLVRATENEFPQSMPADLPKESNFTYCSALEIVGVGDQESVLFDNPVVMYVDNFLNFPVGEIVPIGYFTGKITEWEASENGIVVKLLDASGDGLVDGIDYTGDDIADDIDGDGSTTDEIAGIENYSPDALYWRGSFDHFTWYDFNWGWATPIEALELFPETNPEDPKEEDCVNTNSYVKPKSLTFHEDIEITGTNLTLHYSSQRTQDYQHKISVNVSGDSVEPEVTEMIAVLEIGGNRFEQTFSPAIYQDAEFIWDGTDPSGQVINGAVRGKISIGYRYNSGYLSAGNVATSGQPLDSFATAWAQIGSGTTGVSGRDDEITWSTSSLTIMNAPESHIANGWSISNHHLNTGFDVIYRGDGEAEEVKPASLVLKTGITRTIYDGDDGFYQKGGSEISYNISDQGILNDEVTKLQWQYPTGDFELFSTKAEATNYCAALVLGNDNTQLWRLPTFKELSYTIDKSNGEHNFFIYQLGATNYWSQQIIDDGTDRLVGCVKGETLDDRFAANLVRNDTDNVVIDEENGLMWQDVAENSSETYTWTESIDYCEALDHASFSDWRLPNINELIVALPNTVFTFQTVLPDDQGPWFPGVSFRKPYWASTPDAINDSAAWSIESEALGTGYTQDELFYARCVRNDLTRSRSPYVFDQDGKHIKTIDLDSGITLTTFAYDDQDQLTSISDRFNNTITINRDAQGKATAIVSPDGYVTQLTVDANNNLTRAEYDDVTGYDFVYMGALMTDETDPNGNLFVKTYDAEGRIINTTDPEQGVWQFFNIKDEVNRIMTYGFTTSENNRYETAESSLVNGDARLITTAQDGSITDVVRQADDLKETLTSSDIVVVIDKVLDPKTKLEIPQTITTTLPSGLQNVTTISKNYAENGADSSQLTISSTNNGQTNTFAENFKTGVRIFTSAEGRTTTFNFDPLTRLLQSQQLTGFNDVNYLYGPRGRLTSSTTGDRVSSFAYDDPISKGNITSITDAENRVTSFEYDLLGRLTKTIYSDGRELEQSFDGNGNLISLTPPGQPAHIFNYNSVDKETQYTPPDVTGVVTPSTTYDYDRDRKLTKITRPDNQELIFNYQINTDQLTSLVIPTGTFTFDYDSNQELTSITAPGGESLTFTLDGALQTKAVWAGDVAGDVEAVLDNQFQIVEQKVNGANSVLLGYDNDNLLTSASSLTIDRDVNNGLISGTTLSNINTNQSYNGYAEMLNYNATYNSTELFNVDYTHDKLGRITQQIETIEGVTRTLDYAYDLTGRLIQVKTDGVETESYAYDSNGNRTHINGVLTATYDAQDRLLTHGDFIYTYTDNGELLTKTDTTNSDVTSYVYDVLGNLIEVNLPEGTKIEYIIDGLNRRVGKKVNGVKTKGWLYQDQLNPVAELDGNNNITARFVYADKLNVPSFMEKNGQTYRIISDHLGSPRLVVNTTTGVVVQRIDFDTWGNVAQDSNSEFQPFGFAGGLYEGQTGFTRFGARDYDGAIGRWTSKDPISFSGGDSNIYGYVFNDPINLIDPNGKLVFNIISGVVGAIIGGVSAYLDGGSISDVIGGTISGALGGLSGGFLATLLVGGAKAIYANGSDATLNGALLNAALKALNLKGKIPGLDQNNIEKIVKEAISKLLNGKLKDFIKYVDCKVAAATGARSAL